VQDYLVFEVRKKFESLITFLTTKQVDWLLSTKLSINLTSLAMVV
jgi:hypothetical protein